MGIFIGEILWLFLTLPIYKVWIIVMFRQNALQLWMQFTKLIHGSWLNTLSGIYFSGWIPYIIKRLTQNLWLLLGNFLSNRFQCIFFPLKRHLLTDVQNAIRLKIHWKIWRVSPNFHTKYIGSYFEMHRTNLSNFVKHFVYYLNDLDAVSFFMRDTDSQMCQKSVGSKIGFKISTDEAAKFLCT